MNKTNAYQCLDLDINDPDIDVDMIKRQYRLKALIYHPDKNKSPNAVSKFQEIHDAYEYLLRAEEYANQDSYGAADDGDNRDSYRNLFMIFLKKILENDTGQSVFYNIIQRITTMCESKAFELLERLDKPTLIKTCIILTKYKDAFHITDNIIQKITHLIQTRNENDECIILNPTLKDLYNNNLYKLSVNGKTYIIPLWHHELVYDNLGHDLYVNCLPDLPDHISIDENNNIHIDVKYNIHDIWEHEYIQVQCDTMCYPIQVNTLKLSHNQTLIFAKQGLSKINAKNIYDVSNKSDVYVTLKLTLQ
jgi:GTPase SAR1 family protein